MRRYDARALLAGVLLAGAAHTAQAGLLDLDLNLGPVGAVGLDLDLDLDAGPGAMRGRSFRRIATLSNYTNNDDPADETVSEILAATADGRLLVYTDSPLQQLGLIDIRNPSRPMPAGKIDVGGEPTSVDVLGNTLALVAVNTSESFVAPSGKLVVVHLPSQSIVAEHDLGGQPDALKISADGRYAAIAIENERDEDIEVDDVEGGLPQLPAGYLVIMDLVGPTASAWTRRDVDLSGLSDYAPMDPEPEFVDVNADNQAVVSLQENNHLVVVDLASGTVTADFPAGAVDLAGIDTVEDGVIALVDERAGLPREPDAVSWVPAGGGSLIATANEGDLFGGSRGFSLFDADGNVVFDSGNTFESLAVKVGHYPEARSDAKGTEPEAVEYGRYGLRDFLFVASERGSFVAVYDLRGGRPALHQVLPAPLGPEGVLAIPSRNLLVVSGEEDDPEFGVRSSVMIYRLGAGGSTYPQIQSVEREGAPIAWSAMSGMDAVPGRGDRLLAVWDSFYAESRIFTIDASRSPARITDAITIDGAAGALDPEGIAIAPDDTLWVASEGNASDSRPNQLVQMDGAGQVIREIGLPDQILACRAASDARGTLGSGFEGVAILPGRGDRYRLLVAQQRGWDYTTAECEDLDDDAGGLNARGEPLRSRVWIYDPRLDRWDHLGWELAPLPADASWVGLSEISRTPDGDYVLIERDNRTGDFAQLKTLVRVTLRDARDGLIAAGEKSVYDVQPDLEASAGLITDKPEGVAITERGRVFLVTDNDGVDDWSGETWFLDLGRVERLFRGRFGLR